MFLCSLKEGEDQREITIEPAQALDEVEPLPEDCYTRPVCLPEGKAFHSLMFGHFSDGSVALIRTYSYARLGRSCINQTHNNKKEMIIPTRCKSSGFQWKIGDFSEQRRPQSKPVSLLPKHTNVVGREKSFHV